MRQISRTYDSPSSCHIFRAASKTGIVVENTGISSWMALCLQTSSKAVPSARIIHAQSVKAATARVFRLAMTVTQAQS